MTMVLILSSHVAGSRVGGRVSVSAFEARGMDTTFCPTTLLGRHPGHGAPGGNVVADELFHSMLEGVEAHGLFGLTDAVLTGYFASVEQVEIAARTIDKIRCGPRQRGEIRAGRETPIIMVDPILGDNGALYVKEDIANAIRDLLIPLADIITPNAFELEWLSGQPVTNTKTAIQAIKTLARDIIVTSVPEGQAVSVLLSMQKEIWSCSHRVLDNAPNGTGDLLAAEFLCERLEGKLASEALGLATRRVFDTALKARKWDAFELPDISARQHPIHPDANVDLRCLKD